MKSKYYFNGQKEHKLNLRKRFFLVKEEENEEETWSLRSSEALEIEAATEAPAERTVEATVLAFVDTVFKQDDIIFNEFGNKPLFLPFPFFILLPLHQTTHHHHLLLRPPPSSPSTETNISDRSRSDISSDAFPIQINTTTIDFLLL